MSSGGGALLEREHMTRGTDALRPYPTRSALDARQKLAPGLVQKEKKLTIHTATTQ